MKVVRWLGAFGRGGTLHGALEFELSRPATDEVAAEPLDGDGKSHIRHARVGLLCRRTAVVRVFRGDCWSRPEEHQGVLVPGRLQKTRNPRHSKLVDRHWEAWAHPDYVAIVVKGWEGLRPSIRKTIAWYASQANLPILDIDRGWREVR